MFSFVFVWNICAFGAFSWWPTSHFLIYYNCCCVNHCLFFILLLQISVRYFSVHIFTYTIAHTYISASGDSVVVVVVVAADDDVHCNIFCIWGLYKIEVSLPPLIPKISFSSYFPLIYYSFYETTIAHIHHILLVSIIHENAIHHICLPFLCMTFPLNNHTNRI